MRRFVTAGCLALIVALFAGCSDQDKDSPTEPQFKKVSYDCSPELQPQKEALDGAVNLILMHRPSQKGALSNVDNMARKVCVADPNYDAALDQYYKFETLVEGQNVDKLVGGKAGRDALLAMAYVFATGGPYDPGFEIPPAALEPDGGLGVVTPGTPDTIWTNNDEAAFIVDPGSFAGDAPVTIVMTRLADPQPATPGDPIPGYQAYPEAYAFSASVQLDGSAEFWMCVVLDGLPVPFENLVIGHDLGSGNSELLTPPLYELVPGDLLDCTNADYQSSMASAGTPGWLQLAATLLEPITSQVRGVRPLNAMYFAGKGLGGRGTSFSGFAPVSQEMEVEPTQATIEFSQSLQLDASIPGYDLQNSDFDWTLPVSETLVSVTGDGIVTGEEAPTSTPVEVTATYGLYSATSEISVVDLACYEILPIPVLVLDSIESTVAGDRYWFSVSNYAAYPDAMFWMTNYYDPCGGNQTPSRSWVTFYEGTGGEFDSYIKGYCAVDSASGMQSISFLVTTGDPTPPVVYIEIEDRACEQTYMSSTVVLAPGPQ